jgi:hypothetical protein
MIKNYKIVLHTFNYNFRDNISKIISHDYLILYLNCEIDIYPFAASVSWVPSQIPFHFQAAALFIFSLLFLSHFVPFIYSSYFQLPWVASKSTVSHSRRIQVARVTFLLLFHQVSVIFTHFYSFISILSLAFLCVWLVCCLKMVVYVVVWM